MQAKKKRFPNTGKKIFSLMPSFIKKFIYKRKGFRIGKNVNFSFGSIIIADKVEIDDDVNIGYFSIIKARKLKIGKRVNIASITYIDTRIIEIDDDAIIGEIVGIGGIQTPQSYIRIGKRCHIFSYSILNPTYPLILDDDTSCGYGCYIFTHGSWKSILDGYPVTFGPITIGKGVWLPSRVQIMPNVNIGDHAVIGAGSIVNKDIPSKCLAIGAPAKVIKIEKEFIKNYTISEKNKIFQDILKEFNEFLSDNGFKVEIESVKSPTIYNYSIEKKELFKKKRFKWRVIYTKYSKMPFNFGNFDVYISLSKIQPIIIKKMNKNEKSWFDLEKKECPTNLNEIGEKLNSFLLRFGISFEKK